MGVIDSDKSESGVPRQGSLFDNKEVQAEGNTSSHSEQPGISSALEQEQEVDSPGRNHAKSDPHLVYAIRGDLDALRKQPSLPREGPAIHPHKAGWMSAVQSLMVTTVIAVFVITFLFQAFQVPSPSMEETLLVGDHLLVDKVRFASAGELPRAIPYGEVRRGDIIVFKYPVNPVQYFVKRVVALPGDRLRMVDKQLVINGKRAFEKYAVHRHNNREPSRDNFPPKILSANVEKQWRVEMATWIKNGELRIPPDKYFVLGDNRDDSADSRYWGFVPRENIIGRPLLIYWSANVPDPFLEGDLPDDKISQLIEGILKFFQNARWERTLRPVK